MASTLEVPFRPCKRVFHDANRVTMNIAPSVTPSEPLATSNRCVQISAGAPSGPGDRLRKSSPCGPSNQAVVDEIILGRDIDQSGRNPRKAVLQEWSKDSAGATAGLGDWSKNVAGAASGSGDRLRKSSPCGPSNQAVVDEIILGRDIDQSGRNSRKAALQEWSKDSAGATAGLGDRLRKPSQLEEWSKNAAGCRSPRGVAPYPRLPVRDDVGEMLLSGGGVSMAAEKAWQERTGKSMSNSDQKKMPQKKYIQKENAIGNVVFGNNTADFAPGASGRIRATSSPHFGKARKGPAVWR